MDRAAYATGFTVMKGHTVWTLQPREVILLNMEKMGQTLLQHQTETLRSTFWDLYPALKPQTTGS